MLDEAADLVDELLDRLERPVLQDALVQNSKPDLDLVQPRSMDRRVHELEASTVSGVELLPSLAVMDVEIVPNDVHRPTGDGSCERFHELHQVVGLPRWATDTAYLTRLDLKRRDERAGSMPHIFVLASPPPTGAWEAVWMGTLQGLHPRLLVYAKHSSPLWRMQVQAADPPGFGAKLGVLTVEPHLDLRRPKLPIVQRTIDLATAHLCSVGFSRLLQRIVRPHVAEPRLRGFRRRGRAFTSQAQHLAAGLHRDRRRPTRAREVTKRRQFRPFREPLPPVVDAPLGHPQSVSDLSIPKAFEQQQRQPRPDDEPVFQRRGPCRAFELLSGPFAHARPGQKRPSHASATTAPTDGFPKPERTMDTLH